jgi:hypothetical protein
MIKQPILPTSATLFIFIMTPIIYICVKFDYFGYYIIYTLQNLNTFVLIKSFSIVPRKECQTEI